jgi:hypothetical protein
MNIIGEFSYLPLFTNFLQWYDDTYKKIDKNNFLLLEWDYQVGILLKYIYHKDYNLFYDEGSYQLYFKASKDPYYNVLLEAYSGKLDLDYTQKLAILNTLKYIDKPF